MDTENKTASGDYRSSNGRLISGGQASSIGLYTWRQDSNQSQRSTVQDIVSIIPGDACVTFCNLVCVLWKVSLKVRISSYVLTASIGVVAVGAVQGFWIRIVSNFKVFGAVSRRAKTR